MNLTVSSSSSVTFVFFFSWWILGDSFGKKSLVNNFLTILSFVEIIVIDSNTFSWQYSSLTWRIVLFFVGTRRIANNEWWKVDEKKKKQKNHLLFIKSILRDYYSSKLFIHKFVFNKNVTSNRSFNKLQASLFFVHILLSFSFCLSIDFFVPHDTH